MDTDESLDTRSVPESDTQDSRVFSPNPRNSSNRPETYRTMEVMINLRANLLQELKSEEEQKSCYMREALIYLHKFWKEAFTYIKDGRYPISNNLAERAVRPFTTKRKSSLHFGSDEGAELAAVYHSIISMVKLQGRSAWDYLGKFFTGNFNGCRFFFESGTAKYRLGRMPVVKNQSNLIAIFCEAFILMPYKKAMP